MASDSRWALRFRPSHLLLLVAVVGPAGFARAQQAADPPPPQQAPRSGVLPPYRPSGNPYAPRESDGSQESQPAPKPGALVPQRTDHEAPRLHFRPPDSASADGKRPTIVEAASSPGASGR